MPSSTLPHGSSDVRRLAALWIGVMAGPLVWAALLETNYVLSYVACEQRHTWMLHLASAVALVLVAVAGLTAWRASPPLEEDEHVARDHDRAALLRARFMGLGAVALCAWFIVVIIATEIPALVLHPCSW